jgi:hypothetical protein
MFDIFSADHFGYTAKSDIKRFCYRGNANYCFSDEISDLFQCTQRPRATAAFQFAGMINTVSTVLSRKGEIGLIRRYVENVLDDYVVYKKNTSLACKVRLFQSALTDDSTLTAAIGNTKKFLKRFRRNLKAKTNNQGQKIYPEYDGMIAFDTKVSQDGEDSDLYYNNDGTTGDDLDANITSLCELEGNSDEGCTTPVSTVAHLLKKFASKTSSSIVTIVGYLTLAAVAVYALLKLSTKFRGKSFAKRSASPHYDARELIGGNTFVGTANN